MLMLSIEPRTYATTGLTEEEIAQALAKVKSQQGSVQAATSAPPIPTSLPPTAPPPPPPTSWGSVLRNTVLVAGAAYGIGVLVKVGYVLGITNKQWEGSRHWHHIPVNPTFY